MFRGYPISVSTGNVLNLGTYLNQMRGCFPRFCSPALFFVVFIAQDFKLRSYSFEMVSKHTTSINPPDTNGFIWLATQMGCTVQWENICELNNSTVDNTANGNAFVDAVIGKTKKSTWRLSLWD